MSKPLLLLHYRADCNTNGIWRAAIQSGWSTDRIHDFVSPDLFTGRSKIRYYGNTLHASRIKDDLPVHFLPLNLRILTTTPFAKRRIQLIRFDELSAIREPTFIKPAKEKWFSARVYQPGEKIAPEGGMLLDDPIYIQDPVNIINEMRCFCLNGQVLTSSYYRISGEYSPLNCDEFRPGIIDNMVKELAPHYPPGVVLDFGYTDRGQYLFIEPNEAYASGVYDCDYVKCLEVIEASQVDKTIPKTMDDYLPSDEEAEQISQDVENQIGWIKRENPSPP